MNLFNQQEDNMFQSYEEPNLYSVYDDEYQNELRLSMKHKTRKMTTTSLTSQMISLQLSCSSSKKINKSKHLKKGNKGNGFAKGIQKEENQYDQIIQEPAIIEIGNLNDIHQL